MDRKRFRGFTLVELMAVVAILAVLSTVAIFSYKAYIRKARIQEGAAFLMDIKLKQETYFMTYSRYVDTSPTSDPEEFFPTMTIMPQPWVPGAWDCGTAPDSTTMGRFCSLGLYPPAAETFFQYVTIGWQPGDAAPPAAFIRDPSRRWWFGRARTYMGDGLTLPYELRLTSEVMEMIEIQPPAN